MVHKIQGFNPDLRQKSNEIKDIFIAKIKGKTHYDSFGHEAICLVQGLHCDWGLEKKTPQLSKSYSVLFSYVGAIRYLLDQGQYSLKWQSHVIFDFRFFYDSIAHKN